MTRWKVTEYTIVKWSIEELSKHHFIFLYIILLKVLPNLELRSPFRLAVKDLRSRLSHQSM